MGKPTLQWSPIQLRMAIQQKILPIGLLQGVTMDVDGVSTPTKFEVIEIVDAIILTLHYSELIMQ